MITFAPDFVGKKNTYDDYSWFFGHISVNNENILIEYRTKSGM